MELNGRTNLKNHFSKQIKQGRTKITKTKWKKKTLFGLNRCENLGQYGYSSIATVGKNYFRTMKSRPKRIRKKNGFPLLLRKHTWWSSDNEDSGRADDSKGKKQKKASGKRKEAAGCTASGGFWRESRNEKSDFE